jgi:hypothetical protein
MASRESVHQALLHRIEYQLSQPCDTADVLRLAEAWAWIISPNQPHGAAPPVSSEALTEPVNPGR